MKSSIAISICDDNAVFAEEVRKKILSLIPNDRHVEISVFNNGFDLLETAEKKAFDAVFLDINMPMLDGFSVSEKLHKCYEHIRIIFITSFDEKIYSSWEYNPFWFVRKSHIDDLKTVFPKLLFRIDFDEEKKHLCVDLAAENEIVSIDFNLVMYIEAYRHNLNIKSKENTIKTCRCKVSDAEEQLSNFGFVRIQHGILVNLRFISKLTSKDCILKNGESINIGRKYLENLRIRFAEYLRSV